MRLLASNATPMEREIARIQRKMIGILLLLAGLGVWQRDFILEGVRSHVEITSAILLTFAFSAVMAFIFISKLNNEIVAFKALREMWDDIQLGSMEAARDPLWRHYRCAQPARVFQRPRLLGHAYELVTEELARTRQIRLTVEEMNTLVSDAEQAINDEKSLISYLSGILVFMGLIGTFVGLLHMVGSISAIMGSLAATSTDASESFTALLGAMQEPLKGMASGFAASLFGLFSSLVVGLVGRLAGQAAGVLKNEFKSWLAGVVKIGEEYDEAGAVGRVMANLQQWLGMIGNVLGDYARVAGSFDHAAQLLADMRGAQQAQTDAVERIIGELAQMQGVQTRLLQEITAAASVAPALGALGAGVESMAATLSRRMETEALALRELLVEAQRTRSGDLRMIAANHAQATTQPAEAIGQLSMDVDRRGAAVTLDSARLEAALERGVSGAGRALGERLEGLETRVARLAESQAQSLDALTRIAAVAGARDEATGPALEGALSAGFARVSQTMETAFSAYSSLLHVVVATMEQAAAAPSAIDAPEAPPPATSAEDLLAEEFRRRAGRKS
jgi:hypothetical protein